MKGQFIRTELIYGEENLRRFAASRVAVFGLGGVGGHIVEALARSGIGAIDLIDDDAVSVSNLNRQLIATVNTVGRDKVEAARARIAVTAPDCEVRTFRTFFLPETKDRIDFSAYDYVADAIDTVSGKLAIIECAKAAGVPVISAMGTGNKRHPERLEVADIYETSICPLARVMRHECRKRGIDSLKVVYSREEPLRPRGELAERLLEEERSAAQRDRGNAARRSIPGSTAFVPAAAGLIIAAEIINDLAVL